jgi:hypothetical protein
MPARWASGLRHTTGGLFHSCLMASERSGGVLVWVDQRKDSPYRSGRSPDWLKMKNPDAPAVTREAEEDWAR